MAELEGAVAALNAELESVRGQEVSAASEGTALRAELEAAGGELEAHWRSASVRVHNPDDYSIDWTWSAKSGFPDQFQGR